MGGSKTQKSTTTVSMPPPTAEEERAKMLANLINEVNLYEAGYELAGPDEAAQGKISELQKEYDERYSASVSSGQKDDRLNQLDAEIKKLQGGSLRKRALTPEEETRQKRNLELEELAYNRLKGVADPETQRLVAETYQGQRESGNKELERFLGEQAASRGMSLNDSPLLREVGIQKSDLETRLRGAEAGSLLDVGSRNQLFGAALREFQEGLRQQAFINRAAIGESYSQTASGLARLRAASPTTTSRMTMPGGGFNFGSAIMGGMQGAMAGGQAGGPWGAVGGGLAGFGGGGLSGMS